MNPKNSPFPNDKKKFTFKLDIICDGQNYFNIF